VGSANDEAIRVALPGDNGWRWESPWMNRTAGLIAEWGGGTMAF
jgi:hypothetical protein